MTHILHVPALLHWRDRMHWRLLRGQFNPPILSRAFRYEEGDEVAAMNAIAYAYDRGEISAESCRALGWKIGRRAKLAAKNAPILTPADLMLVVWGLDSS